MFSMTDGGYFWYADGALATAGSAGEHRYAAE
jgi:hypothetical protein